MLLRPTHEFNLAMAISMILCEVVKCNMAKDVKDISNWIAAFYG
jgi:hypothetical protein